MNEFLTFIKVSIRGSNIQVEMYSLFFALTFSLLQRCDFRSLFLIHRHHNVRLVSQDGNPNDFQNIIMRKLAHQKCFLEETSDLFIIQRSVLCDKKSKVTCLRNKYPHIYLKRTFDEMYRLYTF